MADPRYADSIAEKMLRRNGYDSAADHVLSLADGNEMLARERDEAEARAERAEAALTDLRDHMAQLADRLWEMAPKKDGSERHRLTGKAQGMELALSFVYEAIRSAGSERSPEWRDSEAEADRDADECPCLETLGAEQAEQGETDRG